MEMFCFGLMGGMILAVIFIAGGAVYASRDIERTNDMDSDICVYVPSRDRDRSGDQRTCKWLEEVDNESLAAVLRAIRVASKLDMYEQDYLMEAANRLEGAQNEIYNDTNV